MRVNILQILPENAKIKIDKDLTAKLFYGRKVTEWGKILEVHLKNISRYINCSRPIPFNVFIRVINMHNQDLEAFQGKIKIKIGNTGKYIAIGPFLEIDEKWVYIAELLKGDGHITPNFWYIRFTNKSKELIKIVRDFFVSLGLPVKRTLIYTREDVDFLDIRSYLLALILNKIFLMPVGKKMEIDIPDFVVKDPLFAAAAVRGAFDAEGCVSFHGSRTIIIASISKNWVSKIQKLLTSLKIKSNLYNFNEKGRNYPIYRLHINHGVNLKRFYEIIRPFHPERRAKLKMILDNYSRNPDDLFKKKIMRAIKEGCRRKRDIAQYLSLKLNTVGNNIYLLRKHNLIEPKAKIFTNKGCFFEYTLTTKGIKYLGDDSASFFE